MKDASYIVIGVLVAADDGAQEKKMGGKGGYFGCIGIWFNIVTSKSRKILDSGSAEGEWGLGVFVGLGFSSPS